MSEIGYDCEGKALRAGDTVRVIEDMERVSEGQKFIVSGQFTHAGIVLGHNIVTLEGAPEFGINGKSLKRIGATNNAAH